MRPRSDTDTIASIVTPTGGGVGIVRVSGSKALAIAERVFQSKHAPPFESHRIYFGVIRDPHTGDPIDKALLFVYRAPRSYTGEDMIEFSCHGSSYLLHRVLELVWAEGARPAEPGEFTQRAFLNGKLDLAQAEAVADLVRARTQAQHRCALALHGGMLSRRVRLLMEALLGLLARVEAHLDFSEEIGEMDPAQLLSPVCQLRNELDSLLAQAKQGKLLREGVRVAVVGRPNVGKSSLLNALLGEARAIVTPIPGTTRDLIEESLQVRGVPFVLGDTAGLRNSTDVVEQLGIERTRQAIQQADLILLVLDASEGVTEADGGLLQSLPNETPRIIVWNKCDLVSGDMRPELAEERQVWVSALTGTGLESLLETMLHITGLAEACEVTPMLTHQRHIEAVRSAREHLEQARLSLEGDMPPDIVAIDLRSAWLALGEITGDTVDEALIDRIFRDFCIGK